METHSCIGNQQLNRCRTVLAPCLGELFGCCNDPSAASVWEDGQQHAHGVGWSEAAGPQPGDAGARRALGKQLQLNATADTIRLSTADGMQCCMQPETFHVCDRKLLDWWERGLPACRAEVVTRQQRRSHTQQLRPQRVLHAPPDPALLHLTAGWPLQARSGSQGGCRTTPGS